MRPYQSPNVVGILPGANAGPAVSEADAHIAGDKFKEPEAKDQAVLFTAHYDHLGFVPGMAGDNIYNGAADNATGCAILMELARVWSASRPLPHTR